MGPANVSLENYFIQSNRHLLSNSGAEGIVSQRFKEEVDRKWCPFHSLDIGLVPKSPSLKS